MKCQLVVVGAGVTATAAAGRLLDRLAATLPVPVVADRAPGSIGSRVAVDKEKPEVGWLYTAPEGYHLLIDRGGFALSIDPPINGGRPSIDLLFESAADSYGKKVTAVLLDGAEDGLAGLERVRERGGTTMRFPTEPEEAVERAVGELMARTRGPLKGKL